jgi:hypothetical protein
MRRIDEPYTLKEWQAFLQEFDARVAFHNYPAAFQGSTRFAILPQLSKVLDEAKEQQTSAVFAVRNGSVDGFWLDDFHNYIAILMTEKDGAPVDHVAVMSFSGKGKD